MKYRTAAGCLVLTVVAHGSITDAQLQSYEVIPIRNAFGLKPAPPPVDPTPVAPPTPPVKIFFSGITTYTGVKKAYFKMPDVNKPGSFVFPSVAEGGDPENGIRVLPGSINEKEGKVKIEYGGSVMELTFEKDGEKPHAGPGAVAGMPAIPAPGVPGAPGPAMPMPVTQPLRVPPPPGAIPPALGGQANFVPPVTSSGSGGMQNIPTRSLRTQLPTPAPAPQQQTAEQSIINMEIQRALHQDKINANEMPPLPPTPLSE
jgi:hypothetical protein